MEVDTRLIMVCLGRRYASNRLRLISRANNRRSRGRLLSSSAAGTL